METRRRSEQTPTGQMQNQARVQQKPLDIIQEHLRAMEEKDFDRAEALLTTDFQFVGATPEPIRRDEYVQLHRNLLTAFKDWKYNFKPLNVEENTISGTVQITGTHTGTLTLPMLPGVRNVQATGKRVTLPEEHITITLKNGKATKLQVKQVPNGGVPGLLSQIGIHIQH